MKKSNGSQSDTLSTVDATISLFPGVPETNGEIFVPLLAVSDPGPYITAPHRPTRVSFTAVDAVAVSHNLSAMVAPVGLETVGADASGGPSSTASGSSATLPVADAAGSDAAVSSISTPALAAPRIKIVDLIPVGDSAETDPNAEPSLAVNPFNPNQIIAGAFTGTAEADGSLTTVFFASLNGGATWNDYGSLGTNDKSLAWLADGSGFDGSTLTSDNNILTFSGTTTGSFTLTNTFAPVSPDDLDQPWIRTGPSSHVYVAYNNLNNFNPSGPGKTASVNVSIDGGQTFTPATIDRVGGGAGQDAPAVRVAVNGNTVYAGFTRWVSQIDTDSSGEARYTSQVVVVRSDNGGADSFTALGVGGIGSVVSTVFGLFANTANAPLTLGQERTASDMAIAVDPSNASHVVVAYSDAPGTTGSGQLQLIVADSIDGGATWSTQFTTSSTLRAAQPALAILRSGTIGFLYDSYTPSVTNPDSGGVLAQHFMETTDDFGPHTVDTVLATETNQTPSSSVTPYLGDFFDLTGVGSTFYGVFSASNKDNGTNAVFTGNVTFQRDFTGIPGTSNFQLTDGSGGNVDASIDPYFFTASDIACFRRGTLIMTDRGERPVEELSIGGSVVTLSGALRPIKWIGRRAYDARFIAGNRKVLPIRIACGALGDRQPHRDLWVSPEHALYIDGVLVAAALLVNGTTIAQVERVDALEYFHIELDRHDIILADGMPVESYVECDNRAMFQNATDFTRLYPGQRPTPAQFCAPRVRADAAELMLIRTALSTDSANCRREVS